MKGSTNLRSELFILRVLGVFGFLLAHGVSVFVAFALRRERSLERIRALLELSGGTLGFLNISIGILLLTGVAAGFMGRWWGRGWIWVSLGLLIAIYIYMGVVRSGYYRQVRKAAGTAYMEGMKLHLPVEPASSEEIQLLLGKTRPLELAGVGFVGLAVITWLMLGKPF